ncbi:protein VASCULAR ASSOCIATED DEATH 1, chloroplastic-like isoform X3 [Gossypium australe]|uniref:Protein VASCULAR ASSOCIATED DEATH 1, chloroplastic-like isoform X3 n=1 Tax=Gossypium australe TaxID=47621 RepID=A0A5B6UYM0_9ROSI|nr:protein VASCULAR ASSOCIATED DEATH 1, chloroplastic-like isoform X3 [Gossypium australe]
MGRIIFNFLLQIWVARDVPDYFIKVAETKFLIKVDEFFNLYFSDNAINFIKSFHRRRGDKEFKCSSWCLHDKFGHVRDISYQHPIKVYLDVVLVQNFVAARSPRNFKFTETVTGFWRHHKRSMMYHMEIIFV